MTIVRFGAFESLLRGVSKTWEGSILNLKLLWKIVTGEASIIETTNATLAGLVDGGTVRDLPLNGRSFDQLVGLESSAPSVMRFSSSDSR